MNVEQSKESAVDNARQDALIEGHESRIQRLEESTEALLQSNSALNASVKQTNLIMAEGFGLMKKLAAGIVGVLTVVLGGSQVMV